MKLSVGDRLTKIICLSTVNKDLGLLTVGRVLSQYASMLSALQNYAKSWKFWLMFFVAILLPGDIYFFLSPCLHACSDGLLLRFHCRYQNRPLLLWLVILARCVSFIWQRIGRLCQNRTLSVGFAVLQIYQPHPLSLEITPERDGRFEPEIFSSCYRSRSKFTQTTAKHSP